MVNEKSTIACNAVIKNISGLDLQLKSGNTLIISNLKNCNIQAEQGSNIVVFNTFSGEINGDAFVSLRKHCAIHGNITCSKIAISKPLLGNNSTVEFVGELKLTGN